MLEDHSLLTYQILSGHIPFHNHATHMAVVQAIMRDERPPTAPELSWKGESYASLWAIAKRCWPKEPTSRPSMANVERILRGEAEVEDKVEKDESSNPAVEDESLAGNNTAIKSDGSKAQGTVE